MKSDLKAGKSVLTGVKPTNIPHIGNYLGAIRPAIGLSQSFEKSYLFIADYHALTSIQDPGRIKEYTYQVAACWLACGLDPEKTIIYRQSDVPEIFELNWILSCVTPKGLMNRAHAYKAKIQENEDKGKSDIDFGVNLGLYSYPVLMSADILLFKAHSVPVGEDQIQHIEIARDIADKFNRTYGSLLVPPEAYVQKGKLVPGLDGRKMSKSYDNHIPLFLESKKLRKLVMKIVTDSTPPEAPKDPSTSTIFQLYKEFASPEDVLALQSRYQTGIGWGEAKESLFQAIEKHFSPMTERYQSLISSPQQIDEILSQGAQRARGEAKILLSAVKKAIF